MNIAQTIAPAAWSMHSGGWWILGAVAMMLMMGGMMWMMMRGMGGGSSKRSSPPSDSPPAETAIEVLERRFAEGEISVEDYRQRREELANGAGGRRVGAAVGEPSDALPATREEEV